MFFPPFSNYPLEKFGYEPQINQILVCPSIGTPILRYSPTYLSTLRPHTKPH